MATATIVKAWQDGHSAYVAVAVPETGGTVEYIASVAKDDTWRALTAPEKRAALIAAVKAVRDAQQTGSSSLAGVTGTVTV